jgi:hypothetical protein
LHVACALELKAEGFWTFDERQVKLRSFRPLNKESRDIGEFVDDNGQAYLIFEYRPSGGFYIAKLSDDYIDLEKEIAFIRVPLEGGAIVRYDGLYYVIGSHLTGWNPSPNVFSSAPHLSGPGVKQRTLHTRNKYL